MPTLKDYATQISTALGLVATIGGAILYVENNYAHADDVKEVLKSQQTQIKLYERTQRQNLMFQLEYYDDRLRMLNAELETKASKRNPLDIQREINDTIQRRELTRSMLTN